MIDRMIAGVFKIIAVLILVLFAMSLHFQSNACGSTPVNFEYNGKSFESGHLLYDGRMFVPLRTISQQLGLTVDWDEKTKLIEIYNIKTKELAQFQLGSKRVWIYNKNAITMDVEPMIIDGWTFVPIRYVGEALNKKVTYAETKTERKITITDKEIG